MGWVATNLARRVDRAPSHFFPSSRPPELLPEQHAGATTRKVRYDPLGPWPAPVRPSFSAVSSRIWTLRILPVTVIGNSSTSIT